MDDECSKWQVVHRNAAKLRNSQ